MNITSIKEYFIGNDYSDIAVERLAGLLSGAVQYPTVSYEDEDRMDGGAFLGLHAFLEKELPLVHANMERIVINEWSLLYRWKGSDASLRPALFMSHLDVVPISPGTEDDWAHPPFSGKIDGDYVWGRGTLDTKGLVIGQLYAAEYLLGKGFSPRRDIYFVHGHDEETMGKRGTYSCMEYLKKQGIQLEFVLDEGGGFGMGDAMGAPGTLIATIDIFEKGYADVVVRAKAAGGHSSRPGKGTSLGRVARALAKIEDAQLPAHLNPITRDVFGAMAPRITKEPFQGLVAKMEHNPEVLAEFLKENGALAPMVHTTTAVVMINGSPAPNVLPQEVRATINYRIAPEDTTSSVLEHARHAANDDGLDIYIAKGLEPSQISRTDTDSFSKIQAATEKFIKGVSVLPGMTTGGTDARYFEEICDSCYRFRPYMDNMFLSHTAHSTDERCYIPGLVQGTKILIEIIKTTCE